MKYQPVTCVWEITMGCNMRCGHCGSSCTEPLPDELTTMEALDVADQMGRIGMRWVTLSGGEPLTRKDWPLIARRLTDNGISVNIITNGWLITEETVRKMKDSGVKTVAISIDGTRDIHNQIRREGAFEHAQRAFGMLRMAGIPTGAVTTLSHQNIGILNELKEDLIQMGVESWQMQLGLPMGNFAQRPDWLLAPEQIDDIIDFCYNTSNEGRIRVYPADCIGYYNKKELAVRQKSFQTQQYPLWDGCNAGIRSFGMLQNGDILGCTSIRNKEFIEGNIRERSLLDIWDDQNSFMWRRNLTKDQLSGDCAVCKYGAKCLGGCPNTRLTMGKSIYAENEYCSYNVGMKASRSRICAIANKEELRAKVQENARTQEFQLTALYLGRLLDLEPDDIEGWKLKGFCEYMCGNAGLCELANRKALELNVNDTYARKGLGLALCLQGNMEEGLRELEKAAAQAPDDPDCLQDLITSYMKAGEHEKAAAALKNAEENCPQLKNDCDRLRRVFGQPVRT